MSKKVKLLLGCVLIILIGSIVVCQMVVHQANQVSIKNISLDTIQDGNYQGSYTISPVHVRVLIKVKNHQIKTISLLEHVQGLGTKAEKITDTIVDKQSLQVDVVSSATVSSKCILKASERALMKGITHE